MRFGEREAIDDDADSLLFAAESTGYPGGDDHFDFLLAGDADTRFDAATFDAEHLQPAGHRSAGGPPVAPRRSAERLSRRKRRRRMLLLCGVILLVIAVAGSGWVAYQSFGGPKDWTGPGTVATRIEINAGAGASAIGSTLFQGGVVRSAGAYVSAAAKNSRSQDIGPGVYQLRKHMSAAAAVTLLLDPAAHIVAKVSIPEGTIENDVVARVASALKVPPAAVTEALGTLRNLGVPEGYAPASGPLTSAEGFLYPDTYDFDPGTTPTAALQQMTQEFTTADKKLGFADGAKALGITPYQALIIASIAQAEVKQTADAGKVARVVLNRLASSMSLQIDATSAYAAKLTGLDPAKVIYATIDSPYNTYTHSGLPPTPIGNPGAAVLQAVITPPAGDWLYYVNGDAQGDLYFFDNEAAFEQAVATCRAQHWGCG